MRDNEQAAEAYGVSPRNVTLTAFAFSGFLAAFAGGLFVHHQTGLTPGPYAPAQSLEVFSMAVIGGLGSIPGAVLGATYVRGVDYFYRGPELRFVLSGGVLLLVLMLLPGGIGAALADARDWWLRRVARRQGIVVPSLVAEARPAATAAAAAARPSSPSGRSTGPPPDRNRSCACATSTCATRARRSCSASTSPSTAARSSRCSGPTARARAPCSAPSPGSPTPAAAPSSSTGAT